MGRLIKRGEVRWYKFKQPDKMRPVLILSRDSAIEYLGEITIAPITTTVRNVPTEIILCKEDGIARRCAINFDHIQTVSKGKIGSLITTLSSEKLDQTRQALLFALGY